jgi:hypothetical protein
VDFIYFDSAGNSVVLAAATSQKSDGANSNDERETHRNLRDIMRWKH